ncbi:MAG: hypothetical protein Athens101410_626 [Parcubacteria group bacterium Athens1014_10]|nr:MAG: hypothetical protein Athens101410_626 [Parcubacteria group bacterium Athens1014_10]TSD04812.1 MAG: hypothetical protein Athens071412_596 [Parcubacteria group bacterium Athens0714_12]
MKLLNNPKSLKAKQKFFKYLALDWKHIERAVQIFKEKINKKSLHFDKMLVLVRGGMVPASMLSFLINKREMDFFQGAKTNSNKPHDYQKFLVKLLPKIEKGKKYLIVEDIIFEGDTVYNAIQYVKSKQSEVIGACSIVVDEMFLKRYNSKHQNVSLICAYQCENLKWIRFPWENKIKNEVFLI